MFYLFSHLNVVLLLGATIAGYAVGAVWYSPVLFSKAWQAEMKIPQSQGGGPPLGRVLATGFLFTLLSTLGLMVVLYAAAASSWLDGALMGAFIGAVVVGARMLNAAVYEGRSARLLRITVGHEIVLFAVQGAILGHWS